MAILRDLRRGELTTKDMSVIRETEGAKQAYKKTSGYLKEYSLNHVVQMTWGFKPDSRRPFHLIVDNKRITVSWAELKEMDDAGFFRREVGNPTRYDLRVFSPGITIDTDLNDEATRDMIVRITGKNFELYIDWYEMLKLGRFI